MTMGRGPIPRSPHDHRCRPRHGAGAGLYQHNIGIPANMFKASASYSVTLEPRCLLEWYLESAANTVGSATIVGATFSNADGIRVNLLRCIETTWTTGNAMHPL